MKKFIFYLFFGKEYKKLYTWAFAYNEDWQSNTTEVKAAEFRGKREMALTILKLFTNT